MNRKTTNIIRFFMDECLPPIVRDNKLFMFPFYWLAYKGKNVNAIMGFKRNVYRFTPDEYAAFYDNLSSISRERETDLNSRCIKEIQQLVPENTSSAIDVGCGNGFALQRLRSWFPHIELCACDVSEAAAGCGFNFVNANVTDLPFADNSYDVTICSHTLEHILDLPKAIAELKRITRRRLIVVVPCQRYYYYTLDEHVNFFPLREQFAFALGVPTSQCTKIQGDWVAYVDFDLHL